MAATGHRRLLWSRSLPRSASMEVAGMHQRCKARSYQGGQCMSEKKAYPLRINAEVLAAAQRWADDELRSLNAQIEYVLRDALRKAGRLPKGNERNPKENES